MYDLSDESPRTPQIQLDGEAIQRLDALRTGEEEYDEIFSEPIGVYEAEELTLFRGGEGD